MDVTTSTQGLAFTSRPGLVSLFPGSLTLHTQALFTQLGLDVPTQEVVQFPQALGVDLVSTQTLEQAVWLAPQFMQVPLQMAFDAHCDCAEQLPEKHTERRTACW
jgi:hypothetical protein